MKYILTNLSLELNSVVENLLDNTILKDFAFGAKYKNVKLYYDNILIPILENKNEENYLLNRSEFLNHIIRGQGIEYDEDILFSIYSLINPILKKSKALSISIGNLIDESEIGIFYSDGSSSKNLNAASYGCCRLEENISVLDENSAIDSFTEKIFSYTTFSGKINDGTNNIGELTGIKTAVNNLNAKKYQIIISDSEYSIKAFREWIYNWKNNGYKAYNKKPIKNKELIQETFTDLQNQFTSKVVLFKWTKGHADDKFNNICDKLAKIELGIEVNDKK